jgi:4-hydroxy-tetrahydrodipicolinate synthase
VAQPRSAVISNLYVPVVTPFGPTGSIDVDALAAHSEWVCSRGAEGVMLFGTTGEGPSISVDEKLATTAALGRGVPGLRVIASITENSLPEAHRLADGYNDLDLVGVLVLPPGYFREPSSDGSSAFLGSVAARSVHPVLAYHIPSLAPAVDPAAIAELGLLGAKDSGGDLEFTRAVLANGQMVMIGAERVLVDAIGLGAAGAISGMGNLMPGHMAGVCAAAKSGDDRRARALLDEVLAVHALMVEAAPGMEWIPAMKQLAGALSGTDLGAVRLPVVARRDYASPALTAALGATV